MRKLLNTVVMSKPKKKDEKPEPIPGIYVGTLDNEPAGKSQKYVISDGVSHDYAVLEFKGEFKPETLLHVCLDAYSGHKAAEHVKAALDALHAPVEAPPSEPAPSEPAPEA